MPPTPWLPSFIARNGSRGNIAERRRRAGADQTAQLVPARAGRARHFGCAARYRRQHRLSRYYRQLRAAAADDPMGRHLLRADPCRADARLRAGRRHLESRPRVPRRAGLECRSVPSVRGGAELRLAAVFPLSAGDQRGADHQLRPGDGDEPLSRDPAQPCTGHLHADVRARLGGRTLDRRRAGGALGLARRVLVPRADRACRAAIPTRSTPPRPIRPD